MPVLPDFDELLAYKTKKVVVIKDRFLGLLWYAGVTGVFAYFIVDRIIIDQAHYIKEPITSIIETSLRQPDELTPISQLSYCTGGTGDFPEPLPCYTGPDAWVKAPSVGNSELFVATRVKDIRNGSEKKSFVQDPERYTVGISFAALAQQLLHRTRSSKYSRSIQDLKTQLVDSDGEPIPGAVQRRSRFDVIEVGKLLQAAGLNSLDQVRYKGAVILISIECPMAEWDGSIEECRYLVRHLPSAEAKTYMTSGVDLQAGEFKIQERRGLRIVLVSSGEMGRFKWSAFMLAWVSSFGMLSMVKIIVDFIMARVMPLREVYRLLKWEESVDFSDYRDGDSHAVAHVEFLKAQANRRKRSENTISSTDFQSPTPHSDDVEADKRGTSASGGYTSSPRPPEPVGKPTVSQKDDETSECSATTPNDAGKDQPEFHSVDSHSQQQKTFQRIMKEVSVQRSEMDREWEKRLSMAFSREREQWTIWAQRFWNDKSAADLAGQQLHLLKQALMEEQSRSMAYVRADLKDLLLREVKTSLALSQEALQRTISTQISHAVSEGLSGTWRLCKEEIGALRGKLQNDMKVIKAELQQHLIDRAGTHEAGNPMERLARWEPSILAAAESTKTFEITDHGNNFEARTGSTWALTKKPREDSSKHFSQPVVPREVNPPLSKEAQGIRDNIDQVKLELESLKAELAARRVPQSSLDRREL